MSATIAKKQTKRTGGKPAAVFATQAAAVAAAGEINNFSAKTVSKAAPRRTVPKNSAFEAIHSAAAGLHKVGVIDQVTMRNFEAACITQPVIEAGDIKRIRTENKLSQPVFAAYLGTSASTIKQWETGVKHPSGMARTLLNVIKKHGIDFLT
jgi:putative transcriptional regulator